MARAADPADTARRFHKGMCVKWRGCRNIKGSCLACCPVCQQKVSRTGVAMIGCEVNASLHLDAKMGPVACFSQNITKGVVSCHNITPTRSSDGMKVSRTGVAMIGCDGMMSKGAKGFVRAKCTLGSLRCVHTKPPLYGNLMDRCIKM